LNKAEEDMSVAHMCMQVRHLKNCIERKEKVQLHSHEESQVNSALLLSSRCRQRLKGTRG
jgi:hypothetical protein